MPQQSVLRTTAAAFCAVYPAMALVLSYELSIRLFQSPMSKLIVEVYGKKDSYTVNGLTTASSYLLQFATAPIWGRIADAGFRRATLCAAIGAPLVGAVTVAVFSFSGASPQTLTTAYIISTVCGSLLGTPLAVGFALAKMLIRIGRITDEAVSSRAMLLVMLNIPCGVLLGNLVALLIVGKGKPQEHTSALSIVAVAVVTLLLVLMYASGPLRSGFGESLDAESESDEYVSLTTDDHSPSNMRVRVGTITDVLSSDKSDAPRFRSTSTSIVHFSGSRSTSTNTTSSSCCNRLGKVFYILRWLGEPSFRYLALAFALVEFGHEGYFSVHIVYFIENWPREKALAAPVLMLGAGLNAFTISFVAPLMTKCGLGPYTKAVAATTSAFLCYTCWSLGVFSMLFIGQVIGCLSLMFKPSVTYMLTSRLGGNSEVAEAIGALHGFGFVGSICGVLVSNIGLEQLGGPGFLICAAGPLLACCTLCFDRRMVHLAPESGPDPSGEML